MIPKQKMVIRVCRVILLVSMAVMAVATGIQIYHNGWESTNTVTFMPLLSSAVCVALLRRDGR